ncbi:MAG: hypothetical protein P9M13_08820 [Candidatus Ancaeobacter aquaticus]|nr:hypothetical protein [Candidatus Ancaeobacter aquaticus]
MRKYIIKKILNIPKYKVTEVILLKWGKIHVQVEPYKKKKAFGTYTCAKMRTGIKIINSLLLY